MANYMGKRVLGKVGASLRMRKYAETRMRSVMLLWQKVFVEMDECKFVAVFTAEIFVYRSRNPQNFLFDNG